MYFGQVKEDDITISKGIGKLRGIPGEGRYNDDNAADERFIHGALL